MAAITISPERIAQVTKSCQKFVTGFIQPTETQQETEAFLSSYHPDIEWYDHAFLMHRVGHKAVLGLQKSFMHCNQPFESQIKAITPTQNGAVVEQLWVGRCSNDIVRPNGDVVVKGTGKEFKCQVCMLLEIDADGLIRRIDEYYNKRWDDGIPEEQYLVLKGDSLRAKA